MTSLWHKASVNGEATFMCIEKHLRQSLVEGRKVQNHGYALGELPIAHLWG